MPEEYSAELDIGEPPPEVLKYAREHLGEDPDTRTKCLQELQDMIYEKGECTPHRMDDSFLLRFLRARFFNIERSHRLLVNYYLFKEDNPQYHLDVEPLKLRHIGDDDVLSVPPYREQTGRRLMIYRIGNWDPNAYSIDEIFKATLTVLELGILEPRCQILGGVAIFDLENLTLQHTWQVTPSIASRMVQVMVTSFPMKINGIHIINQPWLFETMYAVFKPLLSKRMSEKIYFHGTDMESLQKHIHPTCLPKKYGGVKPEFPYTIWLDSLKHNKIIVKELLSLGYKLDPKDMPNDDEK
ncbi:alpha-tocopherol transfer protein-like isoform X2 [Arctopsyche grandis]